jgi:hypothetical protein
MGMAKKEIILPGQAFAGLFAWAILLVFFPFLDVA